jgi:PPOX class probable FMN-dependent enzyme
VTTRAGVPVTTEAQLRELIEPPHPHLRDKAIPLIDEQSRRFLAAATFFTLATTAADGTVDVSPRGEPAGGVVVLDRHRLAFADRPGNRRLDSFRNILQRPDVGLLFVIPGVGETLRVNGKATLVADPPFLAPSGEPGVVLGVVVAVEELFLHCGQALKRSSLWEPGAWPDPAALPTVGELMKSQSRYWPRPVPALPDETDQASVMSEAE